MKMPFYQIQNFCCGYDILTIFLRKDLENSDFIHNFRQVLVHLYEKHELFVYSALVDDRKIVCNFLQNFRESREFFGIRKIFADLFVK